MLGTDIDADERSCYVIISPGDLMTLEYGLEVIEIAQAIA